MDFFGMGTGEILLILVVALVLWGPGRLVEISRTIGRTMHNLRKSTVDFTSQITRELEDREKKPPSK
jgi:TatA/E family protein of Tat protein translocase